MFLSIKRYPRIVPFSICLILGMSADLDADDEESRRSV